jgi:hypothetical protein
VVLSLVHLLKHTERRRRREGDGNRPIADELLANEMMMNPSQPFSIALIHFCGSFEAY